MNLTQIKCFLTMLVIELIGFGPICVTCLIGFYVALVRPQWFLEVVRNLYRGKALPPNQEIALIGIKGNSAASRFKCFLGLLGLFILDFAPVPVAGTLGLFVVLTRPRWFHELAERLYADITG